MALIKKQESKQENAGSKPKVENKAIEVKKEPASPKTLARGYNTMDDEHKAVLEPNTFGGVVFDATKEVTNSFVTSHVLQMGNNMNYTFGARFVNKHYSLGATVGSNGVAQVDGIVGVPELIAKGSVTVIPQMQMGSYMPIGGPMLSSNAEITYSNRIASFSGKVSSTPSGSMVSSSGALTTNFNTNIRGNVNNFTILTGCEYCHLKEESEINLFSGGLRLTRNSQQPAEFIIAMNNLGVLTSSVLKTVVVEPSKDLKSFTSGTGPLSLSPCIELQVNTKTKKSCLTGGVKVQRFNREGELLKGCTVSVDTNGHCCCVGTASVGKKGSKRLRFNASLQGNFNKDQWMAGLGASW